MKLISVGLLALYTGSLRFTQPRNNEIKQSDKVGTRWMKLDLNVLFEYLGEDIQLFHSCLVKHQRIGTPWWTPSTTRERPWTEESGMKVMRKWRAWNLQGTREFCPHFFEKFLHRHPIFWQTVFAFFCSGGAEPWGLGANEFSRGNCPLGNVHKGIN